jgi:hypothetical protein
MCHSSRISETDLTAVDLLLQKYSLLTARKMVVVNKTFDTHYFSSLIKRRQLLTELLLKLIPILLHPLKHMSPV